MPIVAAPLAATIPILNTGLRPRRSESLSQNGVRIALVSGWAVTGPDAAIAAAKPGHDGRPPERSSAWFACAVTSVTRGSLRL